MLGLHGEISVLLWSYCSWVPIIPGSASLPLHFAKEGESKDHFLNSYTSTWWWQVIDSVMWVRLRVKLLSRTSYVSVRFQPGKQKPCWCCKTGFNIWIYLHKCWKLEQKEEAEVWVFLLTTPLTPILNCFPTPLLTPDVWGFLPHSYQSSNSLDNKWVSDNWFWFWHLTSWR